MRVYIYIYTYIWKQALLGTCLRFIQEEPLFGEMKQEKWIGDLSIVSAQSLSTISKQNIQNGYILLSILVIRSSLHS